MTPLKVLILEDDLLIQSLFKELLSEHSIQFYKNLKTYLATQSGQKSTDWDLILCDLCHDQDPQGEETLSLLGELKSRHKNSEIYIQSGVSDVEMMRRCLQMGASRFILKEHLPEEIPLLMERLQEFGKIKNSIDKEIIGKSDVMQRLKKDLIALRFESHVDVLIEGETGSGKELCARALHSEGPFVAVNVSAIPSELFEAEFFGAEKGSYTGATQSRMGHLESAGTGVLFLDEIQSLPLQHQSKLLRVLETRTFIRVGSTQERSFRARVVSAANRNLREQVAQGQFREDLYYRIAPLSLQVPPLRVRKDDIAELAQVFLKDFDSNKHLKFTPDGIEYLKHSYDWPGNVRELRSLIRTLVLKSSMPLLGKVEIESAILKSNEDLWGAWSKKTNHTVSDEQFAVNWSQNFDQNVSDLEKFLLEKTLAQHKNTEAREKLGLARSRFYEKVKQYGLLK